MKKVKMCDEREITLNRWSEKLLCVEIIFDLSTRMNQFKKRTKAIIHMNKKFGIWEENQASPCEQGQFL